MNASTGHDSAVRAENELDVALPLARARNLPWGKMIRRAAAVLAAIAFFILYRRGGFPFDRERVLLWGSLTMGISCIGRSPRRLAQLLLDWAPFVALMYAYAFSRGLADGVGAPVQLESVVRVERWLFFGTIPAVWVQHHLAPTNDTVHWWELGVSVVYASHFVVPIAVPVLLWIKDRALWLRFATRFVALNIIGLVTYVLLPTAPPWMAAREGLIGELQRPVTRGWRLVHLTAAEQLIDYGRLATNSVAAVPSMHAAYTALIVAYFWPYVRNTFLRGLMLLYPLAMGFSLVYGGEHYVVDILAGWFAVFVAFAAVAQFERMRSRYGGRTRSAEPTELSELADYPAEGLTEHG